MQGDSFSHGLWLPLYIITGGYFYPLQFFSGNATYLEQIQVEFTSTFLLIFTGNWQSFPYASPCPNILSLNGSHSGLLAGEGSTATRKLSTSSSPESFLEETSLTEHLMALAGIQHGCSWVVALVTKSRGSALRNVDSLEDAPVFSYSRHGTVSCNQRPFTIHSGAATHPGNTQGKMGSETRTGTWSNVEVLWNCHMQRLHSEAQFGQQHWKMYSFRKITKIMHSKTCHFSKQRPHVCSCYARLKIHAKAPAQRWETQKNLRYLVVGQTQQ